MPRVTINGTPVERHLNRRMETSRRLQLFAWKVPALLLRHLAPVLGVRTPGFMARMAARAPAWSRKFHREGDDTGLAEVKKTFLLVGVMYQELRPELGDARALSVASGFLHALANTVQSTAYLQGAAVDRTWDQFHQTHESQIAEGFIRHNTNDGISTDGRSYRFEVTRCCFLEAFRDMGAPELTLAFCGSDEKVFNDAVPGMRFHRGSSTQNTLARGGPNCLFIFER